MQLDRIIQPPQHTDSRRMHPTTPLNTPNSHTRGTPESRRCPWSNPLPRECSSSCVSVMVVCRQPLDYRVAFSSKHISPQPYPDPLVSCIATPSSYPTRVYSGFDDGQAPWQPHALPHPLCACESVTLCSPTRCLSHISII